MSVTVVADAVVAEEPGCGVVPRDDPLSSALERPFNFTFSLAFGFSVAPRAASVSFPAFVVGEDLAPDSTAGEGDLSLAVALRSRVDALRVEIGVSLGSAATSDVSATELVDAALLFRDVNGAGVVGSSAAASASATLLDERRLLEG